MSDSVLKAEPRETSGKGAARALRRQGMLPAVIYGDNKDPQAIAVPYKEVDLAIQRGGFLTHPIQIELDGKKQRVLPKAYAKDPVRDFPQHVDFLRVSARTIVTVEVPVNFTNEDASPGLDSGGTLTVARNMVEINAPATSIPESLEVDLTGKEVGDAIKSDEITLPEGVSFTITDRDFAIATITAPRAMVEEDTETPEAGETEVINQEAETAMGEDGQETAGDE